jgi:hypothetical protein
VGCGLLEVSTASSEKSRVLVPSPLFVLSLSLSLSHHVDATSWSLVHDEASRDMSCMEAPYVVPNALMLWALGEC